MVLYNTTPQKDMDYIISHMVPYKRFSPHTPGDFHTTRYESELNKFAVYNVVLRICKIAAAVLLVGIFGMFVGGFALKLIEDSGGKDGLWAYVCFVSMIMMVSGLTVVVLTALIGIPIEKKAKLKDASEIQAHNSIVYKLDNGEIALVNVAYKTAYGYQMKFHLNNFSKNTYPYAQIPFYDMEIIKHIRKVTREDGRFRLVADIERRYLEFPYVYTDYPDTCSDYEKAVYNYKCKKIKRANRTLFCDDYEAYALGISHAMQGQIP